MSTVPKPSSMSLKEYVAWEELQTDKHEFYRGETFAMAGTTISHNRITRNILARLDQLLEGRECEAFGSDLRVRIDAVDLSTYPDVTIVCGQPKPDEIDRHAIVNPRVVFEVLSKSTENYDRGQKFEFYQHLDAFREYIIVYQTQARVIQYVRKDDSTWSYRLLAGDGEVLHLATVPVELTFKEIYRSVEFAPEFDSPGDPQPHLP